MSEITATQLQKVLNSQPIAGWQTAYALDTTSIGMFGGFQMKQGRFQWTLKTAGNATVGAYSASQDLTTGGQSTRDKVMAVPMRYGGTVEIDGLDEALAVGGAIDNVNDLVMENVGDTIGDIFDSINTGIVTGTGTTVINGLPNIIASGSGNYYDKPRSANKYANAAYVSGSGNLTLDNLDALDKIMKNDRAASSYDAVLMSVGNAQYYEKLLRDSGSFYGYKDVSLNDSRFAAPLYAGRPIVALPGLADSGVYFVNSNDIALWAVPQVSLDGTGRQIQGIFAVEKLGKTTDATKFHIKTYVNFILKNPFKQGFISL